MPTNLPLECVELEERYKTAISVDERIAALEEYIAAIPSTRAPITCGPTCANVSPGSKRPRVQIGRAHV